MKQNFLGIFSSAAYLTNQKRGVIGRLPLQGTTDEMFEQSQKTDFFTHIVKR